MKHTVKRFFLFLITVQILLYGIPLKAEENGQEGFSLTMLDVGEGLSVLVQADGEYMLYDGGGRDASSYVVSSLSSRGISELDYMVASHYDEDHISGLVGVLHTAQVDTTVVPDYQADTSIYTSFEKAVASAGTTVIYPAPGDTFSLGSAQCQVLSPASWDNEYENNNSIVIRITYGDFSCLLTGDAEMEAEDEMISSGWILDSDILVVGHHGSAYSTTEDFLDAVSPSYAFISTGEGNRYGFPSKQVMTELKERGIEMWRTDKQGEVSAFYDGSYVRFSSEPCSDWSDGESPAPEQAAENSGSGNSGPVSDTGSGNTITYVLNTNTMKFHYPDCPSAGKISDKNRQDSNASREELLAEGYSPCGNCNP